MSIPKRSTSDYINSVMNQPLYQQAVLNSRNVSPDKRAIGSRNEVLGKLVSNERDRLFKQDVRGEELATRRDELGWQKSMFEKKMALAQQKLKFSEKQNKLANTLGGLSVLTTAGSMYGDYRDNKKAEQEHKNKSFLFGELYGMNDNMSDEEYALAFNRLPKNYRAGIK